MDSELFNNLGAADKAAYRDYEELFSSPGWKRAIAEVSAQLAQQEQRILNATNWDTHVHASGCRAAFLHILDFEEGTLRGYEAQALQIVMDRVADSEDDYG